ncbi:PAP2 (Acid phosphatase) superfamily protein OS=Afipia felis OX=1035 GN=BN961_03590 PE=4 SV=1 [Afipia felis]
MGSGLGYIAAMNRTGLYIALSLSLVVGLTFGLYPELDLRISAHFYDAAGKHFPMSDVTWAAVARRGAMVVAWLFAVPSMLAVVWKLFRPANPLKVPGRKAVFLISTILLCAVILPNATFKTYWGRPRPANVVEFNGKDRFVPWWDWRGACPRHCSFFSGEGGTAFWTYAPAALAPPQWRPLAYTAATVFGVVTGGLRIMFGGHFFTDVVISGLVSFFVVWLGFALIYRWAGTRFTDEDVDRWLTRLAWPGYRWRQRLWGRDVGPTPRIGPEAGGGLSPS